MKQFTIADGWARGFQFKQTMELTGATEEECKLEYAKQEEEMEAFFAKQKDIMKQNVSAQEELNDLGVSFKDDDHPSWERIGASLLDSALVLTIIFTLIIVPSLL